MLSVSPCSHSINVPYVVCIALFSICSSALPFVTNVNVFFVNTSAIFICFHFFCRSTSESTDRGRSIIQVRMHSSKKSVKLEIVNRYDLWVLRHKIGGAKVFVNNVQWSDQMM